MDDASYDALFMNYFENEVIEIAENVLGADKFKSLLIEIGVNWIKSLTTDQLFKIVADLKKEAGGYNNVYYECLEVIRHIPTKRVIEIMKKCKIDTSHL